LAAKIGIHCIGGGFSGSALGNISGILLQLLLHILLRCASPSAYNKSLACGIIHLVAYRYQKK
jgi:hypothetical protein